MFGFECMVELIGMQNSCQALPTPKLTSPESDFDPWTSTRLRLRLLLLKWKQYDFDSLLRLQFWIFSTKSPILKPKVKKKNSFQLRLPTPIAAHFDSNFHTYMFHKHLSFIL